MKFASFYNMVDSWLDPFLTLIVTGQVPFIALILPGLSAWIASGNDEAID